MTDFLNTLQMATQSQEMSMLSFAMLILVAIVMGIVLISTYVITDNIEFKENMVYIIFIMPVVVGIIISLIGSNIASAFSLAGAMTIVRFRSKPATTKEMTFIFIGLAGGLAVGVGVYWYGLIAVVALCLLMIVLKYLQIGSNYTVWVMQVTCPPTVKVEQLLPAEIFEITTKCQVKSIEKLKDDSTKYKYNLSVHKDKLDELFAQVASVSGQITLEQKIK